MDWPRTGARPLNTTEHCITCFPLPRRTGSTLGNKPNSTHIRRQSRRSRQPKAQQASWNAQQQQQMLHGGSPYMEGETAGPNHIEVEEFQGSGFAPFDSF